MPGWSACTVTTPGEPVRVKFEPLSEAGPLTTVKVTGRPELAVACKAKDGALVKTAAWPKVMVCEAGLIVSVSEDDPAPAAFEAPSVRLNAPVWLGVPLMRPVEGLSGQTPPGHAPGQAVAGGRIAGRDGVAESRAEGPARCRSARHNRRSRWARKIRSHQDIARIRDLERYRGDVAQGPNNALGALDYRPIAQGPWRDQADANWRKIAGLHDIAKGKRGAAAPRKVAGIARATEPIINSILGHVPCALDDDVLIKGQIETERLAGDAKTRSAGS